MKNEVKINESEIQIIDTQKSSKIDFRLPAIMKEMVVNTALERGQNTGQFLNDLIHKNFEEKAKSDRLVKEAKEKRQLETEQNYAELDKKLKHEKGDFSVDEPYKRTDMPKENYFINVLIGLSLGGIVWCIYKLFMKLFFNKSSTGINELYFREPPYNKSNRFASTKK